MYELQKLTVRILHASGGGDGVTLETAKRRGRGVAGGGSGATPGSSTGS